MRRPRAKPQQVRHEPYVSCGNCRSGWVEIVRYNVTRATRCWCFLAHQQKLKDGTA